MIKVNCILDSQISNLGFETSFIPLQQIQVNIRKTPYFIKIGFKLEDGKFDA